MHFPKILIFSLAFTSVTLGASNCATNQVAKDVEASAIESNDETGLIEGCGQQLVSGMTYCRKQEGDVGTDALYFVGPPAKCLGDGPCVSFKIYFPDSTPSYGDSIPQGKTRSAPIPFSKLLGKPAFAISDRGFWPYTYEVKWLDPAGKEQHSYATGEILLRVYKTGYIPLAHVESDPNFVWSWLEDGVPVKMTTGMRVFVGKKP